MRFVQLWPGHAAKPATCGANSPRALALVGLWILLTVGTGEAVAFKNDVGYNQLLELLGPSIPDGTGVKSSQVESLQNNSYMPDVSLAEFAGKTIIDASESHSGTSTHATGMARHFYGNATSLAPAIADVVVYESDDYLDDVLKLNGGTPTAQQFHVQNHSWVSREKSSLHPQVLQRLDYTIDTHEMTTVVGIDNITSLEAPREHPELLVPSYNAIAVGRTDRLHSTGGTTLSNYGPGRIRPEIVAPLGSTSLATAVTSSAAALLYDAGTRPEADPESVLSEPMKAILLAGATKKDLAFWNPTTANSLDPVFGAGELNVFHSYRIQAGGQFDGRTNEPAGPVGHFGWDYSMAEPAAPLYYNFEIPKIHTAEELSIALAWNIEVTDGNAGTGFSPSTDLANLDLRFYDSSNSYLGTLLGDSTSTIDNVEHLYFTDLGPGTYTLQVSSAAGDDPRDFGLAWRMTALPTYRTSGDYNGDGAVDASDYTVWRDTVGSTIDVRADGDLNGAVNELDYDIWKLGFGTSFHSIALAAGSAIPEPGSWLLLWCGALVGGNQTLRLRNLTKSKNGARARLLEPDHQLGRIPKKYCPLSNVSMPLTVYNANRMVHGRRTILKR